MSGPHPPFLLSHLSYIGKHCWVHQEEDLEETAREMPMMLARVAPAASTGMCSPVRWRLDWPISLGTRAMFHPHEVCALSCGRGEVSVTLHTLALAVRRKATVGGQAMPSFSACEGHSST